MKTDAALKIMARTIERLKDEAGMIGIQYSVALGKKLAIQCGGEGLRRYMEKTTSSIIIKRKTTADTKRKTMYYSNI